jgi:hypothetical protein
MAERTPKRTNFLLGYGERLNERLEAPPINPSKNHPYTLTESVARLAPQAARVASAIDALPDLACPNDLSVALFTLHPTYLAKSYFPEDLMRVAGFEVIGTRSRTIVPVMSGRASRAGEPQLATDMYVAGTREAFRVFGESIREWPAARERAVAAPRDSRGRQATDAARFIRATDDLVKIEEVRVQPARERVRAFRSNRRVTTLEVVLHASANAGDVLEGFWSFARSLDVHVDLSQRLHAEGLCFLPVRADRRQARALAEFSFLRVVREMPVLRNLEPEMRMPGRRRTVPIRLPNAPAVDPSLRVAVFDGGLPENHPFTPWVRAFDVPGIGPSTPRYTAHGLAVTSALLFGPITPGEDPAPPYAQVDHFRVLDAATAEDDPDELMPVLRRIMGVLQQRPYQFVSLSIGPDLPVDDDEVHVWTAMLDSLFSRGRVLATVAVGNGGELDRAAGNARIQTPADCVNALAIGAADSSASPWQRAPYSSVGPGRSPGVVKPDLLQFGGSLQEPFYVIAPFPSANPKAVASMGTSLAAPAGLRAGLGIRSVFGAVLSPVALKALLIHGCDPSDNAAVPDRAECGWGRVPADIEPLFMSDDSTARIVYQGELQPGQWVRMPIPFPKEGIAGMVDITATFCFLAGTDPQDPMSYTRSGLEVRFRPHEGRKANTQARDAKTKSFFRLDQLYLSERQLRDDAHKWETTLHESGRFRGSTLQHPVFDVHYNARVAGRNHRAMSDPIPYALVVTLQAPREPKLYDRLVQQYRTRLEPLRPQTQVPIRTRGR